jgi:hypothetical protein
MSAVPLRADVRSLDAHVKSAQVLAPNEIVINGVSMPVVFETLIAGNGVEYTFIRPAADGRSPVLVVRNLDPRRERDTEAIRNAFRAAREKYSPKEAIELALFHYQQDTVRSQPQLGLGYSF